MISMWTEGISDLDYYREREEQEEELEYDSTEQDWENEQRAGETQPLPDAPQLK